MDQELDYKKMLLVPGIIMVVLIVAVIIMNVLLDNKAKNDDKTTTTTSDVGRPDIYGADIFIKEGLYRFSNSELNGISFFIERNKEDLTLYYKNGNLVYKPVTSTQELIKVNNELAEYVEFDVEGTTVYLTAYDDGEIEYSDSNDNETYILVEDKSFRYEGTYESELYKILLFTSVYSGGNVDNGHITFEHFCLVIDGDKVYTVNLDNKYIRYDDTASLNAEEVVLNGKTGVADYTFTLSISKKNNLHSIKFTSELFDVVADQNYKYSRFNGDYKKN